MTTTPFEPIDTPEPGVHVPDAGGLSVSEDPDIETPSVPDEDVVPGSANPEPPD